MQKIQSRFSILAALLVCFGLFGCDSGLGEKKAPNLAIVGPAPTNNNSSDTIKIASFNIQVLDANGATQLAGNGMSLLEAAHYVGLSDLQPGDNGTFIVLWIRGSSASATTTGPTTAMGRRPPWEATAIVSGGAAS